jgi:hypothetical protein
MSSAPRWVFKAKKDATRQVVHFEAHLVVHDFSQINGMDYDDTYAPIMKLASTYKVAHGACICEVLY